MLGIAVVVLVIGLVNSQYPANSCGLRPFARNGGEDYDRIVGGAESTPGDHPWSCSLRSNGNHICGGSIINDEWIVTAAHCISATANPNVYTWACGIHDRLTIDSNAKLYTTVSFVRHPQYNARLIQNDIALLRINGKIEFTDYLLPACFPATTDTYEGTTSIASGWGAIEEGGSSARYQMEVSMPVLDDAVCKSRFGGTNDMLNTDTQVCAGEDGQGKDTCQGDSGGPLVVKHSDDNLWYLMGLTSWGYGCGNGGVYTRTSAFRDWVEQTIGGSLPTGNPPPTGN